MHTDLKYPIDPYWTIDKGLSFSSLCKWIVCRHRFFLYAIAGLQEPQRFEPRIEFGSVMHAMLENGKKGLKQYENQLLNLYPESHADIRFWSVIAERYYNLYQQHYTDQKKAGFESKKYKTTPEVDFDVVIQPAPFCEITLKGRIDAIHMGQDGLVMVQENKFKGQVDFTMLIQTLHLDLQAMMYMVAAEALYKPKKLQLMYNVGLRPLGDRYAIKQTKKETSAQFIDRIFKTHSGKSQTYPIAQNTSRWFFRKILSVTATELSTFKHQVLYPILSQFCDWYESLPRKGHKFLNPFDSPLHYCTPFGVYNPLFDGRQGDYFLQIALGQSIRRLERRVHHGSRKT